MSDSTNQVEFKMTPTYDQIGTSYSISRCTDPLIAAQLHTCLDNAESVLNIGAGTGSYEPEGIRLYAAEPSGKMIQQRPKHSAPVVQAVAESLPFRDKVFTHCMTVLSMHHWSNRGVAFAEIRRVTREKFIALTWDPDAAPFWLTRDYFPEIYEADCTIFPRLSELDDYFEVEQVIVVNIPDKCKDGFLAAYWKRPEAYLHESVRTNMSAFWKIRNLEQGVEKLAQDLATGEWHDLNPDVANASTFDVGYRIIVANLS